MSMWINKEIIDFETKNIEPYLYKAVRNRCLNYLKFVKTHTPLDEKDIDFLIQREVFVTPDESLSLEDLERELQQCIESLTPQCKKVFIYSRYHNLKNREIAIMLDISEKAVEKHITKALTEIRGDLIKKNLLPLLFLFFGNQDNWIENISNFIYDNSENEDLSVQQLVGYMILCKKTDKQSIKLLYEI